jgi:hypothetical protein
MVFPVRREFPIAVAACSSVMALSLPTTVAAASASRRARSHRAIACRNACRAGVSSRVWGCVSDGARKRMELGQRSLLLWQLTKIRFANRTTGTDSLPSTPQRQCNPTDDNHGLQGSINADYRRSVRPKKLAITGIASLSEVFGIYPGS